MNTTIDEVFESVRANISSHDSALSEKKALIHDLMTKINDDHQRLIVKEKETVLNFLSSLPPETFMTKSFWESYSNIQRIFYPEDNAGEMIIQQKTLEYALTINPYASLSDEIPGRPARLVFPYGELRSKEYDDFIKEYINSRLVPQRYPNIDLGNGISLYTMNKDSYKLTYKFLYMINKRSGPNSLDLILDDFIEFIIAGDYAKFE